jgi:hypothetical protein
VKVRDRIYAYTGEELGRMTAAQLLAIRHCELCLESYERCGCREGVRRREDEEHSQDSERRTHE